jgi:hypothetical protein
MSVAARRFASSISRALQVDIPLIIPATLNATISSLLSSIDFSRSTAISFPRPFAAGLAKAEQTSTVKVSARNYTEIGETRQPLANPIKTMYNDYGLMLRGVVIRLSTRSGEENAGKAGTH